ncbi:MAG TPA: gluconate 2-dehydrogenase subunit 3 family protein [Solirubrobacteraceae bacterium]|nr:gluconate 2-dehydrogenase subunit 3 family protein [Solirubrobacteraceae bacterium]
MAPDFRDAGHLPNRRPDGKPADPNELPRQRRGRTPQMHGRYPDFDILEQAGHWDPVTREMVLARVNDVPEIRFFTSGEATTLAALCDVLTAQDAEPRIPVINYVDEKYDQGNLDGFQFDDMPDDGEAWRLVARGLDEQATQRGGAASFAAADTQVKLAIVTDFAGGNLNGGSWEQLNVTRAFGLVMRVVLACFYSHPWAWNEIGFGGPAYPRGYSRFGSPDLQRAERETWEGAEHFDRDPVTGNREAPPQ